LKAVQGKRLQLKISNRFARFRRWTPREIALIGKSPDSEVARKAGAKTARLIENADAIDWDQIAGANTIGVSAGASAPEILVNDVIAAFRARYDVTVEEAVVTREDVEFKLPRALADG
jgi:hypothetical protein